MKSSTSFLRGSLLVLIALQSLACGGSAPPPAAADEPPPLDDEPAESAAPASNAAVQKGIDAITAGDFGSAKTILEKAHADNPKDVQAAFYLGVALEGAGDVDGAVEKYRIALALDPDLVEAAVNLSAILLDKGDGAGALEAADAGLAKNAKHAGLLTNRGMALMLNEDMKGAAIALGQAVELSPKDESLRYSYAEVLAASGDRDRAVAELKKLTSAQDVEVLASTARLLGRLKDDDGCIAASNNAIAKKKAPELFVQRGLCHHAKKAETAAKADYQSAIEADASFAAAHYYLGRHYMDAGDKKAARASLQKAKELAGDDGVGKAAAKALKEL